MLNEMSKGQVTEYYFKRYTRNALSTFHVSENIQINLSVTCNNVIKLLKLQIPLSIILKTETGLNSHQTACHRHSFISNYGNNTTISSKSQFSPTAYNLKPPVPFHYIALWHAIVISLELEITLPLYTHIRLTGILSFCHEIRSTKIFLL